MNPPRLALIIHTAAQPEYLARVLSAVAGQSRHPDEVLIADDGSGQQAGQIFERWQAAQPYRCEHLWQEAAGARRARILNAAIARASADYCVFLEGDTVPHPRYIEDHVALASAGHFVEAPRPAIGKIATRFFGREVFGRDRSRALLALQVRGVTQAFRWPSARRRVRGDCADLRGGNLAVWRADLERANGFDESLPQVGALDAELAWRLLNLGVKRLAVAGRAIGYQLWQSPVVAGGLAAGSVPISQRLRANATRCSDGLNRHR
jgi:cellulose synthase/poly-beta-1,6-N-acetylglucosamine synthase-like glycosyltransferase